MSFIVGFILMSTLSFRIFLNFQSTNFNKNLYFVFHYIHTLRVKVTLKVLPILTEYY